MVYVKVVNCIDIIFNFSWEWVKNKPRNKFKKTRGDYGEGEGTFSSSLPLLFPPLSILRHSPLSESLEQATNSQEKLKTIAIQNCLEGVG